MSKDDCLCWHIPCYLTGLTTCLILMYEMMPPGLWVQRAVLAPMYIRDGMEQGSCGDSDGLQSRII